MNKKQAGIILALLALIVLAGVSAAKLNGPVDGIVKNEWNIGKPAANLGDDKTEGDYFTNARLDKDKRDSKKEQDISNILNNQNLSKEKRDEAATNQKSLSEKRSQESSIELALKGKGFEDVLCLIQDDKSGVNIIVKNKEQLDEKQRKQIQDTVVGTSKIKNVEIETKQ